jgi:cellulose synthase/poly-beta-1,6-N-acetylglucosamine synthase-like glycosyltransferase
MPSTKPTRPSDFKLSAAAQKHRSVRRLFDKMLAERDITDATDDQPVTIVVRNRNEANRLEEILESLTHQVYTAAVQIIVADTESRDNSLEVARKYNATIVQDNQADFSYPKSLNNAFRSAKYGIVVVTVAHALPPHNYWLRSMASHFTDPKVAGVYMAPLFGERATLNERLFGKVWMQTWSPKAVVAKYHMGILGGTNCALRKSLWDEHPYDEAYGSGGEDTAWAKWAMEQGYKIIREPLFTVHHSHGLSPIGSYRQLRSWKQMYDGPQPMDKVSKLVQKRYK